MNDVRAPSERERALVKKLVREGLPTAGELIAQLDHAIVLTDPPVVEFEIDERAPRVTGLGNGIIEGRNVNPSDESWSHILLWVENGRIATLEVKSLPNDLLDAFPPPEDLEVTPPSSVNAKKSLLVSQKRHLLTWSMLIAVVVGAICGLIAFAPSVCEEGRCQSMLFDQIPFLTDVTIPEDWARGRKSPGSLLTVAGMFGGAFAGGALVRYVRRRRGYDATTFPQAGPTAR